MNYGILAKVYNRLSSTSAVSNDYFYIWNISNTSKNFQFNNITNDIGNSYSIGNSIEFWYIPQEYMSNLNKAVNTLYSLCYEC